MTENIINEIRETLNGRAPKTLRSNDPDYIHAAVLIPLFDEGGVLKVLFTERTHKVEHHKGQISFPGGMVEEQDGSLEETALRESYEEIGLLNKDVEILGRTDPTRTVVSRFVVHPFVGLIPHPYSFKLNSDEVESIITIPMSLFYDEKPGFKKDSVEVEGFLYEGAVYEYNGTTIWGATARIMEDFVYITGEKLSLPEDI